MIFGLEKLRELRFLRISQRRNLTSSWGSSSRSVVPREGRRRSQSLGVFDALKDDTKRALKGLKILYPTDIQSVSLPKIMSLLRKTDPSVSLSLNSPFHEFGMPSLILHSPTGTGKSYAFLLPLIDHIVAKWKVNRLKGNVHAVILVPSDELTVQMNSTINELLNRITTSVIARDPRAPKIKPCSIFIHDVHLMQRLETVLDESSPSIIVSTPRKLLSALIKPSNESNQYITSVEDDIDAYMNVPDRMRELHCVIVDEADACLRPPGRYVERKKLELRRKIPKPAEELLNALMNFGKPSLILVSASVNSPLRKMLKASGWSSSTEIVSAGISTDMAWNIVNTIEHQVKYLKGESADVRKYSGAVAEAVAGVFSRNDGKPALLLTSSSFPTKLLDEQLKRLGISSAILYESIQSGKSWQENLEDLKKELQDGNSKLILSNFESIRGIDFPFLEHVYIVHHKPLTETEYVHAAGRTGRCGRIGTATSFAPSGLERKLTLLGENLGIEFSVLK